MHHGLAKLTHERIRRDTADKVRSNGHPDLTQPYFSEFAPLLDGRGVRNFKRDFAYDRFALEPDHHHPRLEAYIASLIDQAETENRRAVLGFNRTGLRIAWLKSHFDAYHIHIDRDPVSIWASYRSEADKGNFAFFSMWLSVLEANAQHPLLAPLHDRLGLRRLAPVQLSSPKTRRRQLIEGMQDAQTYLMVFYLWMLCTRHALDHCDFILEIDRAGTEAYRRQTAQQLEAATGLRLDLTEMRSAPPRASLSTTTRSRVEEAAMAALPQAVRSDAGSSPMWANVMRSTRDLPQVSA